MGFSLQGNRHADLLFKISKEKVLQLEGCLTQGDTMKELRKNMPQALNLYVGEPEDFKELAPFPNKQTRCGKNVAEVTLIHEKIRALA